MSIYGDYIKSVIRTVPDWPEQGVNFRDITPLLQNSAAFRKLIDSFVHRYQEMNLDAIAAIEQDGTVCVGLILIRAGRILGGRNFFPKTVLGTSRVEVIGAFLVQHYFAQDAPDEILVSEVPEDSELLAQVLSARSNRKVKIKQRIRAHRRKWVELAASNAREAVAMRLANNAYCYSRMARTRARGTCCWAMQVRFISRSWSRARLP